MRVRLRPADHPPVMRDNPVDAPPMQRGQASRDCFLANAKAAVQDGDLVRMDAHGFVSPIAYERRASAANASRPQPLRSP